jgi:hypothetical protein
MPRAAVKSLSLETANWQRDGLPDKSGSVRNNADRRQLDRSSSVAGNNSSFELDRALEDLRWALEDEDFEQALDRLDELETLLPPPVPDRKSLAHG